MIEQQLLQHHIQKHIISVLMYQKHARFRDLRPLKTDTNLFSYHLKVMVKENFVQKTDVGYSLSQKGLAYVDRVSSHEFTLRVQPKIISMLLVQNSNGDVLLQKRTKQPYIDTWTLPYGKVHINDKSLKTSAEREVYEKLGINNQNITHAGDCYIRVRSNDSMLSSTLAHIFTLNTDVIDNSETLQWARPHKLSNYALAPAVEEIVSRGFFKDDFFFEEYNVRW